jgi:hypothetical protein
MSATLALLFVMQQLDPGGDGEQRQPLFVMLELPLFLMQRLDPEEMGRSRGSPSS